MDTIEYLHHLEENGFTQKQAEAIIQGHTKLSGGHVTRDYLTAAIDRLFYKLGALVIVVGGGYTVILNFLWQHYKP